jgi:hypothetical protein
MAIIVHQAATAKDNTVTVSAERPYVELVSAGSMPAQAGTDISDIRSAKNGNDPMLLPVRGEKRVLPGYVGVGGVEKSLQEGLNVGDDIEQANTVLDYNSFSTVAALEGFKDFIVIRVPHRGFDENGNTDPNLAAEYRFLINPATISVNRETIDSQAMTRAGWQFGVWGEGMVNIHLSGQTPGQYFALGLTDEFYYFTQSYRNLIELQTVFENNGYWFEGEEAASGPLATDYTRRRIKAHQDIELIVGNFIWSGMFDSMTVKQDAQSPFLSSYELSFVAWKERFRAGSPYPDTKHNEVQRGHSYRNYNHNVHDSGVPSSGELTSLPSQHTTFSLGSDFPDLPPAAPTIPVPPSVTSEELRDEMLAATTNRISYSPIMHTVHATDIEANTNYFLGIS